MMRYLVFAGILALQIALGICDELQLIEASPYSGIHLKAPRPSGKLRNCTLETSAKKLYSVYPEHEAPGEYIGEDEYCGQDITDIDLSYAGLWTMTTVSDDEEFTTKFKIRIIREIPTRPASSIDAYAGQWIRIGLDENDTDIRSCNVTIPNASVFNLMTEKIEGVSLYGLCGIRILANKSFAGRWEFHQQVGEYLINHATFYIRVVNEINPGSSSEIEMSEHTWIIGKKDEHVDMYDQTVAFCQLTRPDGSKMPLMFGHCVLKVAVASAYHEGTWRATYARVGKMKLEHRDIVIKTKDPNSLECSHSPGINGEINLLCKTGETNLKFCTFIRPDKYLVNLPVGIGSDNYSYYGNGYEDRYSPNRDFAECGVTIHNPSAVDFGLWTCEMGMVDKTIRGSVINVVKARAGENNRRSRIDFPAVFVRRGDSFKIQCKTDAILKYCWLTSPNGMSYSVSTGGGSGKTLKYDGRGFAMGECGAEITSNNDTESGEWTCHLGIEGGSEIEEKVSVKVTESYFIANNDIVYTSEKTKLTCRTFIGEEGIQYCRWVRPNGHGINRADASRYKLSQGIDQCSLTVLDLQPEDIGKWTCFASLTRFTGQEEWATVQLRSIENDNARAASLLSILLGSGLLIITLIGASYAALFIHRRRHVRALKNPPPYYPQDYAIPNEIRAGADPIDDKDYRY